MKLFAVRDDTDPHRKDLAYLFYYESAKQFYIELPDRADPWETPILLSTFAERKEYTVGPEWSFRWVQNRIVPRERQNIWQILRDNGLETYDEFSLLMLAMGRCAQDDYYLAPIKEDSMPKSILKRFQKHVSDALSLKDFRLLVFFQNGTVKLHSLKAYFQTQPEFGILLRKPEFFPMWKVLPGGYGISWDVGMNLSYDWLYRNGRSLPVHTDVFQDFVQQCIISTQEAADLLDCSRQNIDDLTKRGKLLPIKSSEKQTLYLKSEVLKRTWK